MNLQHLGVIGYGEVGKIFATGLKNKVQSVGIWDLKLDDPQQAPALQAHAQSAGVQAATGVAALCQGRGF